MNGETYLEGLEQLVRRSRQTEPPRIYWRATRVLQRRDLRLLCCRPGGAQSSFRPAAVADVWV